MTMAKNMLRRTLVAEADYLLQNSRLENKCFIFLGCALLWCFWCAVFHAHLLQEAAAWFLEKNS